MVRAADEIAGVFAALCHDEAGREPELVWDTLKRVLACDNEVLLEQLVIGIRNVRDEHVATGVGEPGSAVLLFLMGLAVGRALGIGEGALLPSLADA